MNILLYGDEQAKNSEWLPQLAKNLSGVATFEIVRQPGKLLSQLRHPGSPIGVIVLQIATRKELRDLVEIKELFAGRRVVIILPDSTPESLSLGHHLHPRYLMEPGAPMEWLVSIVSRMAGNTCKDENAENQPEAKAADCTAVEGCSGLCRQTNREPQPKRKIEQWLPK